MAVQAVQETPRDEFAEVFDELCRLDNAPELINTPAPVKAEVPAPAETPAAAAETPAAAAETPAPGETPAPEETPAPPAEEPAAPKPVIDDPIARLADLIEKKQTLTPESAPAPAAPAVSTPEPEIFTVQEKEFLTSYQKDWPDVARAEALLRRAEYRDLVGYVFDQVSKEIVEKQLRPLASTVQILSERTHLGDLQRQISDYAEIRDKVEEWAMKQPAYLQRAYDHVIKQGTVDEIKDLIDRYRRDSGISAGASANPGSKPVTELPLATKKAVAALAPVSSKRSAVVAGTDPNDFDGAWAAAE
jgi:hypothetical protein